MIGITPEWRRSREICARLIPHTTSVHNVAIVAALLAEHDRRVSELLAANTAEVERRRTAQALAERMWPIIKAVAEIGPAHEFAVTMFESATGSALIEIAAALVRERKERG